MFTYLFTYLEIHYITFICILYIYASMDAVAVGDIAAHQDVVAGVQQMLHYIEERWRVNDHYAPSLFVVSVNHHYQPVPKYMQ